MLTRILHDSPELCTFIQPLNLQLSAPQLRHLIHVADGLLVTTACETLEVQCQFVICAHLSNIAATFRIASWTADNIHGPLATVLMQTTLQRLRRRDQPLRLLINSDLTAYGHGATSESRTPSRRMLSLCQQVSPGAADKAPAARRIGAQENLATAPAIVCGETCGSPGHGVGGWAPTHGHGSSAQLGALTSAGR